MKSPGRIRKSPSTYLCTGMYYRYRWNVIESSDPLWFRDNMKLEIAWWNSAVAIGSEHGFADLAVMCQFCVAWGEVDRNLKVFHRSREKYFQVVMLGSIYWATACNYRNDHDRWPAWCQRVRGVGDLNISKADICCEHCFASCIIKLRKLVLTKLIAVHNQQISRKTEESTHLLWGYQSPR